MKILIFCPFMVLSIGFLNLPCQAQNAGNGLSFPRYYAGAYLNTTDYELFYPTTPNGGGTGPWMAAIGSQLTPRWAMQLGYSFQHVRTRDEHMGTMLNGQQIYGWRSADTWTHALPFTARYTIVSPPNSHLHIDLIGGGIWVSSRFADAAEEFVDGQSRGILTDKDHTTQWFITGGIGARYAIGRHLEGVLDYGIVRNLKWAPEYVHLNVVGNKWGITRSISLGLRYRFNLKKTAE